jgi:dTDP-L-rhamnose 4-epimerase
LQNVYGPGQSLTNSYTGIVSLFMRMARDGKAIPVYEDGKIVRDFVFIDDVASALTKAALSDVREAVTLDIGSGVPSTILTLASKIAELYNAPPPQINGMFRVGDVRYAACSIETARCGLDWSPQYSLDDGLDKLRTWIDRQLS